MLGAQGSAEHAEVRLESRRAKLFSKHCQLWLFCLRSDSGVLSSLYSYFKIVDSPPQPEATPEEQEATRQAQACLEECHVEQLVQESKFLTEESLHELLKVKAVGAHN